MQARPRRSSVVLLVAWVWLGGCVSARGSDPQLPERAAPAEVFAANVVSTSALVLAARALRGHVKGPGDVGVALATGAAAGGGFYAAKRWAGQGRSAGALVTAYAATSLAENAAGGDHPLGRFRYGFGPADVVVRTPLSRHAGPPLAVDVDAVSAIGSAVVALGGGQARVRGGVLYFETGDEASSVDRGRVPAGTAIGRLVVLRPGAGAVTLRHETVHVIQSMQADALAPSVRVGSVFGVDPAVVQIETGALMLGGGLVLMAVPYAERWTEAEAYTLATSPPRSPLVFPSVPVVALAPRVPGTAVGTAP